MCIWWWGSLTFEHNCTSSLAYFSFLLPGSPTYFFLRVQTISTSPPPLGHWTVPPALSPLHQFIPCLSLFLIPPIEIEVSGTSFNEPPLTDLVHDQFLPLVLECTLWRPLELLEDEGQHRLVPLLCHLEDVAHVFGLTDLGPHAAHHRRALGYILVYRPREAWAVKPLFVQEFRHETLGVESETITQIWTQS